MRITSLDCLRGIAISLVMLNHFTLINADFWWIRLLRAGGGVDLFFLLSGMLVTLVLLRAKESQRKTLPNIYLSRALRVWPLYFAVIGTALLLLPLIDHPKAENFGRIDGDEWYYFLFLQTIPIAQSAQFRHAIVDVTWSLAIQEQFFWFWPLAIWFLKRHTLIVICVVLSFGALATRLLLAYLEVAPIAIYVLTPARADILAIGCLLALTYDSWTKAGQLNARNVFLAALAIIAYPIFAITKQSLWEYDFLTYGLTLRLLFWVGIIFLLVNWELRFKGFSRNRIVLGFVWLSTFGYGLYLTHIPVRAVVRDLWFMSGLTGAWDISAVQAQLLFYVVAFVACVAVAALVFYSFERPILMARNRWLQGHSKTTAVG